MSYYIFFFCSNFIFQEGDVIELCQVSDIRAGGVPKVGKLLRLIPFFCCLRKESQMAHLWQLLQCFVFFVIVDMNSPDVSATNAGRFGRFARHRFEITMLITKRAYWKKTAKLNAHKAVLRNDNSEINKHTYTDWNPITNNASYAAITLF